MASHDLNNRQEELFNKACDARLSNEESQELESLLKDSPEARQELAELLAHNAILRREKETLRRLAEDDESQTPSKIVSIPQRNSLLGYVATAAFAAFVASWIWNVMSPAPGSQSAAPLPVISLQPKEVATLTKTVQCKWGGSEVPTIEGARVTEGNLDLLEGLATLTFDSGAELVMEAPASLRIIDAMHCRLLHGTIMANVPESAKGFTVDTDETTVVDYGTRFGISASRDGKSMVNVLEGIVEVEHHKSQETKRLTTGGRVDYGGWTKDRIPQPGTENHADREPPRWNPLIVENAREGWHLLSTAFGKGRDTYIRSDKNFPSPGSESFFRVKHTSHRTELDRKGYVAFDLSAFEGQSIDHAQFILHLEPSDLGFATIVPDSTFSVYGLSDETEDNWKEDSLTWNKAPAHTAEYNAHLQQDKLTFLGQFIVEQGIQTGSRSIEGDALVAFLNGDTNGQVTFILTRETDEQTNGGLVHAFATKEHPSNTPPLLRLKVK